MADADSGDAEIVGAAGSESDAPATPRAARLLDYLQGATYLLGSLLVFALLSVGTVGIIAEIKGTWHWAIHLESTISYMGVFVAGVLALLLPAAVLLLTGRRLVDA